MGFFFVDCRSLRFVVEFDVVGDGLERFEERRK